MPSVFTGTAVAARRGGDPGARHRAAALLSLAYHAANPAVRVGAALAPARGLRPRRTPAVTWLGLVGTVRNGHTRKFEVFARADDVESN